MATLQNAKLSYAEIQRLIGSKNSLINYLTDISDDLDLINNETKDFSTTIEKINETISLLIKKIEELENLIVGFDDKISENKNLIDENKNIIDENEKVIDENSNAIFNLTNEVSANTDLIIDNNSEIIQILSRLNLAENDIATNKVLIDILIANSGGGTQKNVYDIHKKITTNSKIYNFTRTLIIRYMQVFLDGRLLAHGEDMQILNNSNYLTLTVAPLAGQTLIIYFLDHE